MAEAEANGAALAGRTADALRLYGAALQAASSDQDKVRILSARAETQLGLDLARRALKDAEAALAINPKYAPALLVKGLALEAEGRAEEARGIYLLGTCLHGQEPLMVLKLFQNALTASTNPPAPVLVPVAAALKQHDVPVHPISAKEQVTSMPAQSVPIRPVAVPSMASATAPEPEPQLTIGAGKSNHPMNPQEMVALQSALQRGGAEGGVDERVALGYVQVNRGNLAAANSLFSNILLTHPRLVGALLGRGTAFALQQDLEKADVDFTSAIAIDPNAADAWKRRGQVRAARNLDAEALVDLSTAVQLDKTGDEELLHQRGLVWYKLRNFKRAVEDFRKAAVSLRPDATHRKQSWNHLGLCLNTIGDPPAAIEALQEALKIDPNYKEAHANLGQCYKELAQAAPAIAAYNASLALDSRYGQALNLRGQVYFGTGQLRLALADFLAAAEAEPMMKDARHMAGVSLQALGEFTAAAKHYSSLVASKPDHPAWYNREVMYWMQAHLDLPFLGANMDSSLHPWFKEFWCKRSNPAQLPADFRAQKGLNASIPDVAPATKPSPDLAKLLAAASMLGGRLQYSCPGLNSNLGFLPNPRHLRTFGLAIIHIAQLVRPHWRSPQYTSNGSSRLQAAQRRLITWRDVYDVAVTWRQVVEPNDPVWWVDALSPEQFAEGFGSHTPMVTFQTKVVRYFPYAARAVRIMKEQIKKTVKPPQMSEATLKTVDEANDWAELHVAMKRDFWVTTPCRSSVKPTHWLDGTRLTIQTAQPEGYEFSIRTPGTPPRWAEFEAELSLIWGQLTDACRAPKRDMDAIARNILHLSFYWYNFMPLSRGTAAVGYTVLIGLFLSCDTELDVNTPVNTQVDWEAILGPTPDDFAAIIGAWMLPARKQSTLMDQLPQLTTVLSTLRHVISAVNAPITGDA